MRAELINSKHLSFYYNLIILWIWKFFFPLFSKTVQSPESKKESQLYMSSAWLTHILLCQLISKNFRDIISIMSVYKVEKLRQRLDVSVCSCAWQIMRETKKWVEGLPWSQIGSWWYLCYPRQWSIRLHSHLFKRLEASCCAENNVAILYIFSSLQNHPPPEVSFTGWGTAEICSTIPHESTILSGMKSLGKMHYNCFDLVEVCNTKVHTC